MIWISKRDILPGRMAACGESFQCGTDRMYEAAPAALGICEYTDPDDPDTSWSLRVFNDYDTGFKVRIHAHVRIHLQHAHIHIHVHMPRLQRLRHWIQGATAPDCCATSAVPRFTHVRPLVPPHVRCACCSTQLTSVRGAACSCATQAHFPVPSPILFRMVFNVIPEWVPGPFPLGFSFSSQEYIDSAVASNGGNAAYKPYIFESDALIGPRPDFGKGF